MVSAIERAADVLSAKFYPGLNVKSDYLRESARAVFASIDPEWLGDFIAERRDRYPRNPADMDSGELADAILAHLTGDPS